MATHIWVVVAAEGEVKVVDAATPKKKPKANVEATAGKVQVEAAHTRR